MTAKQKEIIKDNLRAFTNNFGQVRIEKEDYGKGFYVFYPADSKDDSWIQYCYDINYLNGWLYGIVQGCVRGEFKEYRTGVKEPRQHKEGWI